MEYGRVSKAGGNKFIKAEEKQEMDEISKEVRKENVRWSLIVILQMIFCEIVLELLIGSLFFQLH